jgi:cytochrome c553
MGQRTKGKTLMKTLVSIAAIGFLALPVAAAELAEWAYPVDPPPKPPDAAVQRTLSGSAKSYTQAQIDDGFNPPDWYPQDHPPMPDVVAHGRKEANARACALCHLTNGAGHPESASIAGLPVRYILRQMAEFKIGMRNGARAMAMVPIAKSLGDKDFRAAAEYYAALKPVAWYKVVETDTVPKSYLGNGAMRFPLENGGTEPIGRRIIELPQNDESAESRDPRTGFVAYVPTGSIKKGESIVADGAGGKTIQCSICHGTELRGVGDIPQIIGRSPTYVFRQLNDIKLGTRDGSNAAPMKNVVQKLTEDDLIAIASYLVSKGP